MHCAPSSECRHRIPPFLSLVSDAQPPSVDVARRVGYALDALQHYDAARARDELLEAVAEAPGYAPAYTYLSQAWSALGYRDKALAAAEQAVQHVTFPFALRSSTSRSRPSGPPRIPSGPRQSRCGRGLRN